ncbi:hypothetical protein CPB85DRAFT_1433847 [Mucidula mucida]|nr:hypothetical protein CPB85DRAFT_1433847 [Mucidula mucida]
MNLVDNRLSSSREFEPISAVPSVVFSQKHVAVLPGRSATVSVEFSPPEGLDASALPIYSGKIVVSGSNGDELGIPYFGLAADLKGVFDTSFKSTYPFSVSTLNRYNINTKPWWTFDLSIYDYPIIYVAIRYGAPEIRFDIYEPGYTEDQWEYPPSVGSNGYLGAATTYAGSENGGYFNPATMSTDDVVPFPLVEISRNAETEWSYHEYWWLGSFANGSDIVNGQYALRFSVLRPFGDRAVTSDWSVWSTPEVTVNRTTAV